MTTLKTLIKDYWHLAIIIGVLLTGGQIALVLATIVIGLVFFSAIFITVLLFKSHDFKRALRARSPRFLIWKRTVPTALLMVVALSVGGSSWHAALYALTIIYIVGFTAFIVAT